MRKLSLGSILVLTLLFVLPHGALAGDGHDHGHRHHPHGTTHDGGYPHVHTEPFLSHPIVTESPIPETALKLGYTYAHLDGEEKGHEHTPFVGVEYAFSRNLGLEVNAPYTFLDLEDGGSADHLGNIEVALKYANYTFADRDLLLAAAVAVELPTGDDDRGIGDDRGFVVEPTVSVGWRRDRFEFIGTLGVGVPVNQGDEVDLEGLYAFSFLYHLADNVAAIVELHGESILAGEEEEETLYASPGVVLYPFPDADLHVGLGVSVPVSGDREFDFATNLLLIMHF